MPSKNQKTFLIICAFIFLMLPFVTQAGLVPCANSEHPEPCTLCHLIVGFWGIIDYGFKIFVFIAVVGLVGAGIMYIVSAGSEEMMKTAKTFIKQILIGFAVILGAWLLVYVVMTYFAVKADLGIGIEAWNKFKCSTTSSAVLDGNGDGDNLSPLTASPGGLTFASTNIGSSSSSQTVTITNSGTSSATISNISVSGTVFTRPAGSSGGTCANNQALAANATCTVSVIFSPTAAGTSSGTLTVTAGGQTTTVSLTGTGTGGSTTASLTASPGGLTFASTNIGSSSSSQTVTMTNSGTSSATISNISVSGTGFTRPAGSSGGTCANSQTLAASATCTISIVFSPTAVGTSSGTLTVTAGGQTTTVNLSGIGTVGSTTASLTASPSQVDFGNVNLNQVSSPRLITFTNNSNQDVTINSVIWSNRRKFNWSYSNLMCTNARILRPNESCTMNTYFIASSVGRLTGTLTVNYGSNSSVVVNLSGTGILSSSGNNSNSGNADLGFTTTSGYGMTTITGVGGSETTNGRSANYTISIINTGSEAAGPFKIKTFIHGASALGPNAVLINTWDVSGLAAGQTLANSFLYAYTDLGVHGTYYVINQIDADNQVKEINESVCAISNPTVGCNTFAYEFFVYR